MLKCGAHALKGLPNGRLTNSDLASSLNTLGIVTNTQAQAMNEGDRGGV